MKLDDILVVLGEFGSYQRRIYALVGCLVFFHSWTTMVQVFISASVDHWCAIPEWESSNCSSSWSEEQCAEAKKNASIPANYTAEGVLEYAQCEKYNMSEVGFDPGMDLSDFNSSGARRSIPCDHGWNYDDKQYTSTVVTDFDLVCGSDGLMQVSQSVFYVGILVGSIVFGLMSDAIGRWWTAFTGTTVVVVSGFSQAFAPSWWVFTVMRFFQGCGTACHWVNNYIIVTELMGPSKRFFPMASYGIPYALGYMALTVPAYFIRDWRTLVIASTVPFLLFYVILFFLPESARWYMATGRYGKAEKIVIEIAKENKRTPPDPIFTTDFKNKQDAIRKAHKPTALDLLRVRSMRGRTAILIYIWMVNALVYHGLSLNTSNLGVDVYVSFAVFGAVEIPSVVVSLLLLEWRYMGRKYSLVAMLLIGGVACLLTTFIPPGPALTVVAMVGKFGISASFRIIFLYTMELNPTEIRAVALGTCSMFSRVANLTSPFVLLLRKFWPPLPLVVFGFVTVVAGMLALFLPETRGIKLPETFDEGENYGQNRYDTEIGKDGKSRYSVIDRETTFDNPVADKNGQKL